jgi:hypothetical protein
MLYQIIKQNFYRRPSDSNVQANDAPEICCCIMTMLLLTPSSLSTAISSQDQQGHHHHPDLVSRNLFLFPRLKFKVKGKTFNDTLETQQKSKQVLQKII